MSSFVLTEPTGKYFVKPSYTSWKFTSNIEEATCFKNENEANRVKEIIRNAIACTYWDYDDIKPYPEVKEI